MTPCRPATCGTLACTRVLPASLADMLIATAANHPRHGVTYVDGVTTTRSYPDLLDDARRVRHGLRAHGCRPGEPILLHCRSGLEIIVAFWACRLGGFVAVPVLSPATRRADDPALRKVKSIWDLLERPFVVASDADDASMAGVAGTPNGHARVATVQELLRCPSDPEIHAGRPDEPGLMLLTSGSTGTPKLVVQTDASVLRQAAESAAALDLSESDTSLNWFPLDHVGGLVMFHTVSAFTGARQVHATPHQVLRRPLQWLDWIEQFGVSMTWAPNFAFARVNDELRRHPDASWDLSRLRIVIDAGEPIVAATAQSFARAAVRFGAPADVVRPAFGMSETCSGVTFGVLRADAVGRADGHVDLGPPLPGVCLRITDADDRIVGEGDVGHLQLTGAMVTRGYYRNDDVNRQAFAQNGWLRTGDLALIESGRLMITGRHKDVIIVNGMGVGSHEIEAVVERVCGVNVSYTAACAVRGAGANTDALAIFFNTDLEGAAAAELAKTIRRAVFTDTGVTAKFVVPLSKEQVPKTAIGKIQRSTIARRWETGEYSIEH